ncbi:FAD-binding oxidoreductase [Streptosporangium sp. KLBMP 9127]|nr:FAD-binding oxidoreductase [Streptosporangium sp. KLBMP 9127]
MQGQPNEIADGLRDHVRGQVLAPGEPGFDDATRPWNAAIEQPVAAVVEAADADDVAALVRFARSAELTVSAQPSGHGASGDVNGVILVRTARLDEVEIRPEERLARVGAGVRWGELLAAAGPYGLTGLAGSSPVVSVVGYTLGGGLSWYSRRYGFASDSVRAFEIVDADGTRARVTADSDADLFWAMQGGGGDFALVTAMEFDLHPSPELYGGRMLWPVERAPEVLEAFREITAEAPDDLTTWFDLLNFPGAEPWVAVHAAYLGTADEGRSLLSRLDGIGDLISDSRASLPAADLGTIAAEPTAPSPGLGRGELLTGLDDDTVKSLLSAPIDPLLRVQLRHLGGALARPSDTPAGSITEAYNLYMLGSLANPDRAAAIRARQLELRNALAPQISGRKLFTYLAPGERAAAAFSTETLARLQDVKRKKDPSGVFKSNYPVLAEPATAANG